MVTAGLLSLGWGRAEAVFAEPDGGAGRACGYAAHAEQLQHGLAAREHWRLLQLLVWRPIGFPGHGDPPG
jgi:hypothetical protein